MVKTRVFLALGAAGLAVAASLAWNEVRSEREFRRLLGSGEQAQARGQTLEAIEAYSGALTLRPDSMVAHLKRGDSYRMRGDYEAALRDLREATALDSTAPQPVELLADVNAALGRYDRAIDLYRQFLALDEQSPRVLYKLGLVYYRTHRLPQATDALRRALTLDERMSEAHYVLGVCLRDQRKSADAITSLRRAVALNPGAIGAREALAETYGALGRRREQLEQLEAIAALEPERPERIVSIAVAYAKAGRTDAAVTALDRLGDDLPDDAAIRTEVARAWLTAAAARNDRALSRRARTLLNGLAARPDAAGDVLALLGHAQLLANEVTVAERTLQRAVARVPVSPSAFIDLAEAATRLGHRTTARSALIDYTTLTVDEEEKRRASLRIARLSLALNDAASAAAWARRAINDDRPSADALEALALAELRQRNRTAARSAVDKGLAIDPRHAGLLRLQRQLR